MNSPEILGTWLQQDPIGFDAGDVNLYRIEGNNPLNRTDPSGLQTYGEGFWYGDHLARMQRESEKWKYTIDPYSNPKTASHAKLVLIGDFTSEQRTETIKAFQHASQKINTAYIAITKDWDKISETFKYINIPNIGKRIDNDSIKRISANRELFKSRLEKIINDLRSEGTKIKVVKTSQTHSDGNPMFTVSTQDFIWFGTERAEYIGLRTSFWDLPLDGGGYTKTFWTVHELSRYLLLLDDNDKVAGGHGVQEMDEVIDKLAGWEARLKK